MVAAAASGFECARLCRNASRLGACLESLTAAWRLAAFLPLQLDQIDRSAKRPSGNAIVDKCDADEVRPKVAPSEIA
jgi:hypothetical protein